MIIIIKVKGRLCYVPRKNSKKMRKYVDQNNKNVNKTQTVSKTQKKVEECQKSVKGAPKIC